MTKITGFMGGHHDDLDALFAAFRRDPEGGAARVSFTQFDAGLRAHIEWEEDILFPAFEEVTGMQDVGPTAVMRVEHQQIKQLLRGILAQIGTPDAVTTAKSLAALLKSHNEKEETVLYPWLDQSLPETQRVDLLDRIRRSAFAGESGQGPTRASQAGRGLCTL